MSLLEPKGKLVSRYPNAKDLAHKDVFSQMMKFAQEVGGTDEDEYDFVPATFTLPSKYDSKRFEEYMAKHKSATYIAKPQVGAQGEGMALFSDLKDLPMGLEQREVVVQRYLDKPLLLDGIKFDLRVYVVVVGLEDMKAYICDEGLARFCTVSGHSLSHSCDYFRPNTSSRRSQTSRKRSCI